MQIEKRTINIRFITVEYMSPTKHREQTPLVASSWITLPAHVYTVAKVSDHVAVEVDRDTDMQYYHIAVESVRSSLKHIHR